MVKTSKLVHIIFRRKIADISRNFKIFDKLLELLSNPKPFSRRYCRSIQSRKCIKSIGAKSLKITSIGSKSSSLSVVSKSGKLSTRSASLIRCCLCRIEKTKSRKMFLNRDFCSRKSVLAYFRERVVDTLY